MTDFQTIRTDISEGIFTLTLHRPERMNAFTGEMMVWKSVMDQAPLSRLHCRAPDALGKPKAFALL